MFSSLVLSPLTKVLGVSTAVLLATSSIMVWVYLGTRDELASLKTEYAQSQQDLKECGEAKERTAISCSISDNIKTSLDAKVDAIEQSTAEKVKALDKIPKKSCQPAENKNEQTIYVDIDAPFDDEFKRVFKRNKD